MIRRFSLLLLVAVACQARDLARYAVVLEDAPAGRTGNRAALLAAHVPVRNSLRAKGAKITSESQTLLNAIFVETEGVSRTDLEAIPGVRYVARMPAIHLMLDRAVELLNVPAAWNALGGVSTAGTGVRIAVIDTGIEATHPAFQDATLKAPAGYPACSVAKLPLLPLDCTQFTNGKVIVARSYVSYIAAGGGANPALNSRPDDYTPRDRVGHGTAVAMAAAGVRNTGPSATITGVAPKAWLGSYKVFGSPGVNDSTSADAVLAALEDAFADGMDVAVLSLGAPAFAGPDDAGAICGNKAGVLCDPFAAVVKNAVIGGMVVVAAAGNEGLSGTSVQPTYGSMTTPAHSAYAIAVGAVTNSHNWSNALNVPGLGSYHSLLGAGPAPSPAATVPLGDASAVGDAEACNPLPSGSLAGTYALLDRGTCTFAVKVQNAAAAGALGAIIMNVPGDNSVLTPGGLAGTTTIPAAFVGYDDGQVIRTFLQATPDAKASMNTGLQPFDVATANQLAGFSSRGPTLGNGGLKPDVSAPGTDLYLASQTFDPNGALFAPSGYMVAQGTSFAAPLIGGIAALVKQANPALTAVQIKSAIVNTATADVAESNGTAASLLATGNGRANAANAIASNLAAAPVSVSFGVLGPVSVLPVVQTIQLTNTGKANATLTLAVQQKQNDAKAKVALDRASLVLAAGQTVTLNLTMTGSTPDPGVYEGIIAVQGGATPFRIPYVYMVSDGIPRNMIPLAGDGDDGTVGKNAGVVLAEVTDRYGIAVPNAPINFTAVAGGGVLRNVDTSTDVYGFAGAGVTLGPEPGVNTFIATSLGLSTSFSITGRKGPQISAGGVVDAASFAPNTAVAPGSYIAIYGADLSPTTQVATTANLPVGMNHVSVSFDAGAASFPGRLHFVTPGQINTQVPWDMPSNGSAQMKVSIGSSSTALYSLPLAAYAPGMFEYQASGTSFVAARDENFALVGPGNPAKQGKNIQMYCNGLGPVTNQPATGEPSSATVLSETTTRPVVTIGGQAATVLFSGLTPTVVGLYQINVTVPNVGAGVKPVTVTIGGITSKASNLSIQ